MNPERPCARCRHYDPSAPYDCTAYGLPSGVARETPALCGPVGEDFAPAPEPEPLVWPWVVLGTVAAIAVLLHRLFGGG